MALRCLQPLGHVWLAGLDIRLPIGPHQLQQLVEGLHIWASDKQSHKTWHMQYLGEVVLVVPSLVVRYNNWSYEIIFPLINSPTNQRGLNRTNLHNKKQHKNFLTGTFYQTWGMQAKMGESWSFWFEAKITGETTRSFDSMTQKTEPRKSYSIHPKPPWNIRKMKLQRSLSNRS